MSFRTFLLALSVLLLSVGVAFTDDVTQSGSTLPKEVQELDPDRMARPTGSVNTVDLAHQLGVTDTVIVWFKFKINDKGEASKIEFVHNPGSDEVVTSAQNFIDNMSFAVPTGRNKRKTHYYGLTICPDCSYSNEMSGPVPDPARPEIVSEAAWNEALETLHLDSEDLYRDCVDTTIASYPNMLEMAPADYPQKVKRKGIQGKVEVQCIVGTTGRVDLARVSKSSGSRLLDQASVDAAYKCRFAPAHCDGNPIPCIVSFDYEFRLNN